jgi:hypothetical protein
MPELQTQGLILGMHVSFSTDSRQSRYRKQQLGRVEGVERTIRGGRITKEGGLDVFHVDIMGLTRALTRHYKQFVFDQELIDVSSR